MTRRRAAIRRDAEKLARSLRAGDLTPVWVPDAVVRMPEAPRKIHVEIVESDAPPGGVGEPGVPPIAPAIANAVFALTGTRVRDLPLSRMGLA